MRLAECGGMKPSTTLISGVLLASVLSAATASAKPKHWHDDDKHSNRHDDERDERHEANCYFRHDDVRIIREVTTSHAIARSHPASRRNTTARAISRRAGRKRWSRRTRRGYIDGSIVVYSPRTHVVVDAVTLFRP